MIVYYKNVFKHIILVFGLLTIITSGHNTAGDHAFPTPTHAKQTKKNNNSNLTLSPGWTQVRWQGRRTKCLAHSSPPKLTAATCQLWLNLPSGSLSATLPGKYSNRFRMCQMEPFFCLSFSSSEGLKTWCCVIVDCRLNSLWVLSEPKLPGSPFDLPCPLTESVMFTAI